MCERVLTFPINESLTWLLFSVLYSHGLSASVFMNCVAFELSGWWAEVWIYRGGCWVHTGPCRTEAPPESGRWYFKHPDINLYKKQPIPTRIPPRDGVDASIVTCLPTCLVGQSKWYFWPAACSRPLTYKYLIGLNNCINTHSLSNGCINAIVGNKQLCLLFRDF